MFIIRNFASTVLVVVVIKETPYSDTHVGAVEWFTKKNYFVTFNLLHVQTNLRFPNTLCL